MAVSSKLWVVSYALDEFGRALKDGLWSSIRNGLIAWVGFIAMREILRWLFLFIRNNPTMKMHVWSLLVQWFQTRVNAGVRNRIQSSLALYHEGVRLGHPHGDAATNRNSATKTMTAAARACGLTPYVVSPSLRETDVAGIRSYYQLNDFAQKARADDMPSNACIIMTDIDYYVEWEYWLSFAKPVLLYTFVPETPGDNVSDGHFSMTDNVVEMNISGGGSYKHELWDYNADSRWVYSMGHSWFRRVQHWIGLRLGLEEYLRVTIFSIDQWQVGNNRRIISLVPYAHGPNWTVSMTGEDPKDCQLKRLRVQVGDGDAKFNVMKVQRGDVLYRAISRAGDAFSAVLPESKFIGAEIRYKSSTSKCLSDVVRYVGTAMSTEQSAVLAAYLAKHAGVKAPIVSGAGTIAEHFLCLATDVCEEGKRYARRYAPKPLSREAVFPVESKNNEEICIQGRIVAPQKRAVELMATSNPRAKGNPASRYVERANEFVEFVVANAGCGKPKDVDDVIQVQDQPRQRERSGRRLMDVVEKFYVSAFQKREAYACPNEPRNISTCPTMHTLKLSSFTLAFKEDCLKSIKWYLPGKTPVEIATALMELANENECLVEGDYSRFDGSISRWLRVNVEFACYLRWVDPEYAVELHALLKDELNPKAFTKMGLKYEPGCSRLSGSPLTTDGNTLINAFVGYMTLRERGCEPKYAFEHLGVCYGDDSVLSGRVVRRGEAVDKPLCDLVRVASAVGLQLKAQIIAVKQPVMFLSRIFVNPWDSLDSMSDPMRALQKIHTTVDTTSEIELCGFNKASAYLVTDGKTPMLSNWCNAYLKALGRTYPEQRAIDLPWWYVIPEHRAAPWPQDSIPDRLDIVSEFLGVTATELQAHMTALDNFDGEVDELPHLSVEPMEAKVDCVVGGEMRSPRDPCLQMTKDGGAKEETKQDKSEASSGVSLLNVGDKPPASMSGGDQRCDSGDRASGNGLSFSKSSASTSSQGGSELDGWAIKSGRKGKERVGGFGGQSFVRQEDGRTNGHVRGLTGGRGFRGGQRYGGRGASRAIATRGGGSTSGPVR